MPGHDGRTVHGGHRDPGGQRPDGGDLGAGLDLGAGGDGGLREHVDDLAEAAPRVVEDPALPVRPSAPGRGPQHLAGDAPQPARADPAPGLLGVDPVAGQAPQLHRVRRVEGTVQLRPEPADQQRVVRVGAGRRQRPQQRVPGDPPQRPRRERAQQLGRAQREADPPVVEPEPAVARAGSAGPRRAARAARPAPAAGWPGAAGGCRGRPGRRRPRRTRPCRRPPAPAPAPAPTSPRCAARQAAASPAGPAPSTTTSAEVVRGPVTGPG